MIYHVEKKKLTLHTVLLCGDERHTHLFLSFLLLLFNVKLWRR